MSQVSVSIEQRMVAVFGRSSGFDYMRLVLATAVVALHSVIICYGQAVDIAFWTSEARPLFRLVLPMFFALSGFLVAGSLVRSRTLGMFLGLRAIRIFPALSVEVLLSALVLGALVTTLPSGLYFTHPEFLSYFWNLVGHVHFRLPGVFEENPHPLVVNGQLWTVPYELYCYIALALFVLIGAQKHRIILPIGSVAVLAAYALFKFARDGGLPAETTGPVPGALLVVAFLAGVSIHAYRAELAFSTPIAFASAVLAVCLLWFVPYGEYVAMWPVTYMTVYLGLLDPPRLWFVRDSDYSYGLFLYSYPIQQTIASAGPVFQDWQTNFLLSMVLGLMFAALSWHVVEKPALGLKRPMRSLEDRWLARQLRSGSVSLAE
ncbi:MAG: acyltransferase [Hyphomicrobium sp.]|nr:acyltransferase [Hyphomicrobium sp.]